MSLLFHIAFGCSQIRLDYPEFSGKHGNVRRKIVDYLPGGLPLLRGSSEDLARGLRWAIRRTEASSMPQAGRTAELLATTGCRAPCGW